MSTARLSTRAAYDDKQAVNTTQAAGDMIRTTRQLATDQAGGAVTMLPAGQRHPGSVTHGAGSERKKKKKQHSFLNVTRIALTRG